MKIEKVNENQFRCTMTMGELLQRHLTLKMINSDSTDTRRLVREMIERSADEVGFEPNEYPVMVEAVRNPEGDLVFTVTKITSPDDLPPQFRQQADSLRFINNLSRALRAQQKEEKIRQPQPLAVFCFNRQDGVTLPPRLKKTPEGVQSSLFLNHEAGQYYLVVTAQPKAAEAFRKTCLLLSEYGRQIPSTSATKAYYAEHTQTVYPRRAIEQIWNERPEGKEKQG